MPVIYILPLLIHFIVGHAPKVLLLGHIFDVACLQWQGDSCYTKGSCLIYDTYALGFELFLIVFALKGAAVGLMALALFFHYRSAKSHDDKGMCETINH